MTAPERPTPERAEPSRHRRDLADSVEVPELDSVELAARRQAHLRQHLNRAGLDLVVLTNPVSIRYATDYRGYATFQSRIPSAYLLLPADGPVVLHGAYTDSLSTIDRCDLAHSVTAFDAGLDPGTAAARFADDVLAGLAACGLDATATIGVERATPALYRAFADADLIVADAEGVIELARSRKIDGELAALRHSIDVAELAMARMHRLLRPGVSENRLIAELHRTNIEYDGDWIDGRMLCSGPRTNPWYQEAGPRVVARGELVAFDTDMIGPFGYCADVSRTWTCADSPSPEQRDLHARAVAEIEHNIGLLRVGASFAEISQNSYRQADRFVANRYACVMHGVGLSDEYPKIPYPDDWHWTGYDGEVEAGTVLSVESYVGADGGTQGVKLEQMVQVTGGGVELLSKFPLALQPY